MESIVDYESYHFLLMFYDEHEHDICPYFVSLNPTVLREHSFCVVILISFMNSLTTILWSDFSNILATVCRFYQDNGEQHQVSVASV